MLAVSACPESTATATTRLTRWHTAAAALHWPQQWRVVVVVVVVELELVMARAHQLLRLLRRRSAQMRRCVPSCSCSRQFWRWAEAWALRCLGKRPGKLPGKLLLAAAMALPVQLGRWLRLLPLPQRLGKGCLPGFQPLWQRQYQLLL